MTRRRRGKQQSRRSDPVSCHDEDRRACVLLTTIGIDIHRSRHLALRRDREFADTRSGFELRAVSERLAPDGDISRSFRTDWAAATTGPPTRAGCLLVMWS